jgi:hypothetical protein
MFAFIANIVGGTPFLGIPNLNHEDTEDTKVHDG